MLKNMLKLVAGEGIGRLIGIVFTPIIARIYLPEGMGVLAVFTSLLALMAPFSTFRYSLAIPLPRRDKTAANLFSASFLLLLGSAIVLYILFLLFGQRFLSALSMDVLIPYNGLIPIGVFGIGVFELLSQWGIRKKAFTPLATTSIWQKVIGVSVKIGLGLANIKPLGLLIGDLLTQMGGIGSLLHSFSSDIRNNLSKISIVKMRYALKRYVRFPLFRVPSQFLLAASGNIHILYFAWQFDAATTGQIALARTLLSIPVTYIGYSLGKAFYGEIAAIGMQRQGEIYVLTKRLMSKLFRLSLLPLLFLLCFAPFIFDILFGSAWHSAGDYARLFSIYLVAQFIYSPLGDGIFNVYEKQSTALFIEFTRLLLVFLTLLFSYLFHWNAAITVAVYSLGLLLQYVLSIYIVFNIIKPKP